MGAGEVIKDWLSMKLKIAGAGIIVLFSWIGFIYLLGKVGIPLEQILIPSILFSIAIWILVGRFLFKVRYFPITYGAESEFYSKYGFGKVYDIVVSAIMIIGGLWLIVQSIYLTYSSFIFLIAPIIGIILSIGGLIVLIKSIRLSKSQ